MHSSHNHDHQPPPAAAGTSPTFPDPTNSIPSDGCCARCGDGNAKTRSHCQQCGSRLPWIPTPTTPNPARMPQKLPPVKVWSFWAGETQKRSAIAAGIEGFYPSQWCQGADKRTGLAIDESSQKLCLLRFENELLQRQLFAYADLLGSEIVEDGYTVASTTGSSLSPVGGQGPLPRGLSQKARSGEAVKTVAFKLILNAVVNNSLQEGGSSEPETLVHIVRFLGKETARGSGAHRIALDKAQHWHRLIMALMHIEDLKRRPLPVSDKR